MTKADFTEKVKSAVVDDPTYNVLNFNEQEIGDPLYEDAVDMAVSLYNALPPTTAFSVEGLQEPATQYVLDLAIAEAVCRTAMKHLRNEVRQQSVIVEENNKYMQYANECRARKAEALQRAREGKHNLGISALAAATLGGAGGIKYL